MCKKSIIGNSSWKQKVIRQHERRAKAKGEEAAARTLAMIEKVREKRMEEMEEEAVARTLVMTESDRQRRMAWKEEEVVLKKYEAALQTQ